MFSKTLLTLAMGVVAGALLFSTDVTPARAEGAVEFKDIEGKWCGEISNYRFTRSKLTVDFHSDRDDRVMLIKKINTGIDKDQNGWIELQWEEGGNTVFADFTSDKRQMAQQANVGGDKGPKRIFKRCK